MRIAILSPLFPPDVAIPAPYVKELAARLATNNAITVLTYSHLPEAVSGAHIHCIDKRQLLPRRLFLFSKALLQAQKQHDLIIVENGISTELPAFICSFFSTTPLVLELSDPKAVDQCTRSWLKRTIQTLLQKRAVLVLAHNQYRDQLTKPEIISFEPFPQAAIDTYEAAWRTHLTTLQRTFAQYDS